MMNDDRFDDLLQEAAREHNSAPETPRAEMWAAIAAVTTFMATMAAIAPARLRRHIFSAMYTVPIAAPAFTASSAPP